MIYILRYDFGSHLIMVESQTGKAIGVNISPIEKSVLERIITEAVIGVHNGNK